MQSIVQAEHLDKLAPLRNSLPSTARKAEAQAPSSPQAASRAAFAALAKQGSGSRGSKISDLPCSPAASDLIEVSALLRDAHSVHRSAFGRSSNASCSPPGLILPTLRGRWLRLPALARCV